jgi:hypothetical protein
MLIIFLRPVPVTLLQAKNNLLNVWQVLSCLTGKEDILQQETNLLILGGNIPLRISYQSSVILLSDKHNYIHLVYLVFIRYYYSQ